MQRVRRRLRRTVTGSGWQHGAGRPRASASPGRYFVRGQKKPRSPSPSVRGTTCMWRCATLWLTTLFMATNVPLASSAAGNAAATVCTAAKNGPTVPHRGRRASPRGDAAPPARARRTTASGRGTPRRRRRGTPRGRRGAVDDRAEHASVNHLPPEYGRWPPTGPVPRHPPADTAAVGYTSAHDRPPTIHRRLSHPPRSDVDRPASVRAPCPSSGGRGVPIRPSTVTSATPSTSERGWCSTRRS